MTDQQQTTEEKTANEKAQALMEHIGGPFDAEEREALAEALEYAETDHVECEGCDWLVLTDEEAEEKAKEYILDSLWAFNASFLSKVTGFDASIFEAIKANDRCDDNNAAILQLIGDNVETLVDDAIGCDGRGHFMNTYDGEEYEIAVNGTYYYIYRTN